MDKLPPELFTHIGSFLPWQSRRNCLEASHKFLSINHAFNTHIIDIRNDNISKIEHYGEIVKYIKHIKPRCDTLYIEFGSLRQFHDEWCTRIQELADFVNTTFANVYLICGKCSYDVMETIVCTAFAGYKVKEYSLFMYPLDTTVPLERFRNLEKNIQTACTLDIYDIHCNILQCKSLMSKVNKIKIIVNYTTNTPPISLEHVSNVGTVCLNISRSEVLIQHVQNVTELYIDNMATIPNQQTIANFLQSFHQHPGETSRIQKVCMIDSKYCLRNSGELSDNILYQLLHVLPRTCRISYVPQALNAYIIPILKRMRRIKPSVEYHYYGNDSFLLSKVIKHFISDIKCDTYRHTINETVYVPPRSLEDVNTLSDVYQSFNSQDVKDVWHWLQYM